MKFTLNWLKRFLTTSASLEEISNALTALGLEVEEITDRSKELGGFKVAKIISAERHPDAEKLQICQVDTGLEILQVVCGAPNARAGIKVVFASVGSVIPNGGFAIKAAEIRGVKSNGMLCSEQELLVGKDQNGIIELPLDAEVGSSFLPYYGLDDPVIEISLTPNRSDCLGVYGIARDLAASGIGSLALLDIPNIPASFQATISAEVTTPDCSLLTLREIKGLKNSQSPVWLQQLLRNIGMEPISAIVDITNYINISFAQPMHAYDRSKIGNKLTATYLHEEADFIALNGKNYKLTEEDLVISDDNAPQAIAGIIGGEQSKCDEQTTNIVLEAAIFAPNAISAGGRRHYLTTDSRHRFERGIDHNFTLNAASLAIQMLLEYCGGQASEIVIAGKPKVDLKKLTFNPSLVQKRIGILLPQNQIVEILTNLGFEVKVSGEMLELTIPSWRHDIAIPEDITEEVIRLYGYDKIELTPLPDLDMSHEVSQIPQRQLTSQQKRTAELRRLTASLGYNEVVTWSFMPKTKASLFAPINPALELINPITESLNYMRPTIMANLLEGAAANASRSVKEVALFEIGPVFKSPSLDGEELMLSGIMTGETFPQQHCEITREIDIYDIKSHLELIITESGMDFSRLQLDTQSLPSYYHPGRSSCLKLGKNIIGYFGQIHPKIQAAYDLKTNICGFEIFLKNLPLARSKYGRRNELVLSPYQPVNRDFAFVVDKDKLVGEMINYVKSLEPKLIKKVDLFDVYAGDKMLEGKKSVAISVILQADDHTLTEQELNDTSQKIINSMAARFNAILRG